MKVETEPGSVMHQAAPGASIRSQPLASQEARDVLRVEIDRRERELASLKRRYNADIWVVRLPDELLHEIFLYCLAWWKDTYTNKDTFERYYAPRKGHHGWVSLTHVCHHWRAIALSAPLLWTDIKVLRRSLTAAFLLRSRQAPLTIQCRVDWSDVMKDSSKYQMVKKVLAQSHRIRSLRFQYSNVDPATREAFSAVPDMGRYEFPQLRHLTLLLASDHDHSSIPSFIARASLPKLEELDLRMYDLSALSLITTSAPCLTRLSLYYFITSQELSWTTFFNVFGSLPQLEVLTLFEGLPPVRTQLQEVVSRLPSFHTTLTFPNLKTFNLTCQALSCATLLQHMSFPVTTKVRLEFSTPFEPFETDRGSDLQLAAPVIFGCMSGDRLLGTAGPIMSVGVDTMDGFGFDIRICAWRRALPIEGDGDPFDSSNRDILDDACFQITLRTYSARAVMTRFCKALPFATVESLFVGELRPNGILFVPTRESWIQYFGFMVKVKHLVVYEQSTRLIGTSLKPVVHAGSGGGRPEARVLFPELEVVKLQYSTIGSADLRDFVTCLRQTGWRVPFTDKGVVRTAVVPTKLRKVFVRKAIHADASRMNYYKVHFATANVEFDWDGITSWTGQTPSRRGYLRNVADVGWVDDMPGGDEIPLH